MISSLTDPYQQYHIIKCEEICNNPCLRCKQCNICIHTFNCSCTDNIIKMNICKHIHACAREFYEGNANDHVQLVDIKEQQKLLEIELTPSHHKIVNNSNIVIKTELVLGLSTTTVISDENAKLVEKKLDEILNILNNNKKNINLKLLDVTNTQKKIEPQVRLYSTKRKRTTKNELKKPSIYESNTIKLGFENNNSEFVNVHSGFDHYF